MADWTDWDISVHQDYEQHKRFGTAQKIKPDNITLDTIAKTAVIVGSGEDPYEVTLDSCTCFDYLSRKLPCKHIYRLAQELGYGIDMPQIDKAAARAYKKTIPGEIERYKELYYSGALSLERLTKMISLLESKY